MLNSVDTFGASTIQALQKKVTRRGIHYSLDRLTGPLAALGNPHHHLPPVIHIAGTNGKGSVAHYLTEALRGLNHRVITLTSPHILHYTERFKVNNSPISMATFTELYDQVAPTDTDDLLSEYEILTLMGFVLATQTPADFLIMETGLGGRLDATNVVPSSLAIITDIGFDHTDILGKTLADIANEKAGIIKPNAHVITHIDHPSDALTVIKQTAKSFDATIHWTAPASDFDRRNRALAESALHVLLGDHHNAYWDTLASIDPPFGRMTPIIINNVNAWIDVGHNPMALHAILDRQLPIQEWIIGMQPTKDYVSVISALLNRNLSIKRCEFDQKISLKHHHLMDANIPELPTWQPSDPIAPNTLFFGSFYFINYVLTHTHYECALT